MGCCDYPKVDKTAALVILVLNILFPGFGTMIGGCINANGCDCGIVCTGILQSILTCVLAGWIWSIIYGVKLYQMSS